MPSKYAKKKYEKCTTTTTTCSNVGLCIFYIKCVPHAMIMVNATRLDRHFNDNDREYCRVSSCIAINTCQSLCW